MVTCSIEQQPPGFGTFSVPTKTLKGFVIVGLSGKPVCGRRHLISSHVCMKAEAPTADCDQGMARFKGHR